MSDPVADAAPLPAPPAPLPAAQAMPPHASSSLPPPALTAGETLAPADPAQPVADALAFAGALWRPALAASLAGQQAWLESLQQLGALQQQHGRETVDLLGSTAETPMTPGTLFALWGKALSLNLLQAGAVTRQVWFGWTAWERAALQEFEDLAVMRGL